MNQFRNKKMKKQKDVLFILTQDLNSPSGLGRYFPISKSLVKEGYSVSIVALHSNYDSLTKKTFVMDGVNIAYVSQMHIRKEGSHVNYFNNFNLFRVSIKATWRLLKFIITHQAKVVVIGKPHPMNSIAGLIGGRLHRSRIILDCDDYEAASNYFSSPWQQWIIRAFENTVPKIVDHIISNTHFNRERMISLGISPDKIDYLPNGIDQERFENFDPLIEVQIKRSLNLEGKKVIAYLGSLSLVNHPVDILIHAFKAVVELHNNAFLLVVGGGKDIEVIKTIVKEQGIEAYVNFVGRVPPDLVPYYYRLAHVSVDPVYDNDAAKGRCPLKMFESWAMGTPFVTANVGDRKMLSGNFHLVTLANPGNHLDLKEKMLNILNDSQLTSRIINYNLKRVKNYYWHTLVNSKIHLFSSE